MADALKKLMDLKLKAYHYQVKILEDEFTKPDADPTVIDDTLEIAELKLNAVFEVQLKLIEAYAAAGHEAEYLDEEAHQGKLQREIKTIKRKAYEAIGNIEPQVAGAPQAAEPSKYHLPQMKLPTFSGDVREWLGFWASFESIHNNPGISATEKFQYLLQCLKDDSDARRLINSFPVCAKNYAAAVETLRKQFGRPKMLVKVYVLDLLQLVIKNATNKNKVNVTELVPQLASQIRNLSELGVTRDKCEEVLYPVVEASLPDEVLQAWQRNQNYDESLEPLMDFLNNEVINQMDRTLAKMTFGSSSTSPLSAPVKKQKNNHAETPAAAALMVVQADGKGANKSKQKCAFCDLGHETRDCGKAKTQMTLDQRVAAVKEKKLCFQCLKPGHITKTCKSFVRCSICGGRHYEMMCSGKRDAPPQQQKQQGPINNMMISEFQQQQSQFMNRDHFNYQPPGMGSGYATPTPYGNPSGDRYQYLDPPNPNMKPSDVKTGMSNVSMENVRTTLHTLLVKIVTKKGDVVVRAFIDDGSDDSYITKELAESTGQTVIGNKTLTHQLFGARFTAPEKHNRYKVTLRAINGQGKITANFNATDRIAHRIRKPPSGKWLEELEHLGVQVVDQTPGPDGVQLLIGMDIAAQIWTGGFVRLTKYFFAMESTLGWVVGGKHPEQSNNRETYQETSSHMVTSMLISDMKPEDLWSLEVLGITDEPASQTKKELEAGAWEHFKKTVKRNPDGRYEVEFPWIQDHQEIKNNYGQAVAQLNKVTTDLRAQNYFDAYDAIFKQWLEMEIIEEVPDQSSARQGYYMPHRHVIKENSETTPLRPVFNASAKTRDSASLNDCLVKGPNMLEVIPAITIRFRRYEYGAVSDVEKAFLQISVALKDRDYVRFVWWVDQAWKKIKILRHKRVVFGVRPSPFLLAATLKYHLEKKCQVYPDLAQKLINSLYVDNSVSSHPTMKAALDFQRISQHLLLPAKFNLRGWEFGPSSDDKVVPVLGMNWHTKDDTLSLCLENTKKKLDGVSSKRGLLSIVNSVFDPLGFVCPVTVTPKLLFQQCCIQKLTWDQALPEEISIKLEQWKKQVADLEKFRIPRWMANTNEDTFSIHTFSNGSSAAFATCIFLRSESQGKVSVQLVQAKSRIVPKDKKMTIPRIELMSCLIGVRLTREVKAALSLKKVEENYWTDSTTALAWIQHDKPWGRFVQGRVTEIRQHTKPEMWRHVPGEFNPADLPSRGCTVSKFLEIKWHEGPAWLRLSSSEWPISKPAIDEEEVKQELKKVVVSMVNVKEQPPILLHLQSHSNFYKSVLVIAVIQRFLKRLKSRVQDRRNGVVTDIQREPIPISTVGELEAAENAILKMIQQYSFTGIEDKRIIRMGAFVDRDGLIRIKSQLLFGKEDFSVRCPIVLPHDHEMVLLLIRKEHEANAHAGVQTLQAILRERYWILRSRRTISSVVHKCVRCRLFLARKCDVPSAPLPLHRIQDTFAFNVTGVDLAGPLFVRGGDRVWIVLFTDAVFRGIHLELVNTLSTEGFVSSLRRFVARRGRPTYIYSDNGLNFVGCNNLFKQVDWSQVTRYAAVERIQWRFNPPTGAWWGGWWERMVGLVKTLLRRILGKQVVSFDQLQTILCDVEATINQRPLTFLSDEAGDLLPLCPVHFMRDNPGMELPEADVVDSSTMKKGILACQKLREELRTRFRKEYLAQLQHHAGIRNRTVKPGDVVLIEVDDKKRIDWPWGVVQEVYPGRDGNIRTALVKTRTGCFLRPVQRLFILEAAVEAAEKIELPPEENVAEEEMPVPDSTIIAKTRFGREVKKPDRLRF